MQKQCVGVLHAIGWGELDGCPFIFLKLLLADVYQALHSGSSFLDSISSTSNFTSTFEIIGLIQTPPPL